MIVENFVERSKTQFDVSVRVHFHLVLHNRFEH